MPNEHMPGGDFNACVGIMQDKGHSEDSAKRICGAIKDKWENNTQIASLTDNEWKFVEQFGVSSISSSSSSSGDSTVSGGFSEVKVFEQLDNVDIFAVGTWNKDKYSTQDLQEMVNNFNNLKEIVKPPAKIGHSESQDYLKKEGLPAAGWVDKLRLVGNKVVASFKDVPKVVKDLIDKKAYKRVSAEIYPKYKDPRNGKIYNNVLRAVAFLGSDTPAVETLSDIAALYNMDNQDFKTYGFDLEKNVINQLINKGGDLLVGKYKVSIEGASKEELVKKLSDSLGEGVKVNVEDQSVVDLEEQKKIDDEKKNQEIKDKRIEELSQQYEAVTKLQGDKDKEIADLKAQIADLQKQLGTSQAGQTEMCAKLAEIQKNTKLEAVKSFVKQQIVDGKVLPKDESVIVALMEQLDDKLVVKFTKDSKETSEPMLEVVKKFISGLPKSVDFNELAPNIEHKVYEDKVSIGGVSYDVQDLELVQKAEKYAQDNKVAFDVALLEVTKTAKE